MKNRKVYIYKITSPNGKIYIGSTVNLKDRIYRYKTYRVKSQVKIYNSLIKYGFENHKFEVIYECNESDRNYYEFYYGKLFDVIGNNGLNLSLPKYDDVYITMSEETKKKIGDAHRGKIISDEQKKQISIGSKKWHETNENPMKGSTPWNKGKSFLVGDKNPMYGVKRSEEWKKNHSIKMAKLLPSGTDHHKSKIILDTYTGIYYYSIRETSICNNIIYSSLKERIRKNKEFRFLLV